MSIRVLDFTDGFESGTAPTDVTLEASEFTNGGATITLPTTTDTLVGRATTDTLTNKTMDGDDNTFQDIARSALKAGTASHVIINDGSGVLSSEAILAKSRGGVGYDLTTSAIELPEIATPSTPASGFGRIYFKTDGKPYSLNDAGTEVDLTDTGGGGGGGGSGGINYITNPDAETDVTGWAAYADAAGSSPVDGTGGAPTVTITRTTSSPLRDTGSFLITKDAANRQGEGVSYDFTVDYADLAKPLAISFDYEPSANFVAGDSSDIRVWLYDVTNAQLIQPAPYTIQGGSGAKHRFIATFQTSSNSTSYRLIAHVATTNASAWTFKFDNVIVGPQTINYGSPVTDFRLKTVTIDNITISTQSAYFRRVGDSLEGWVAYTPSASAGSAWALNLPDGLSVDSAKLNANQQVGLYFQLQTASTNLFASVGETNIVIFYDGTNHTKLYAASVLVSNAFTKLNGSNMSNTPQRFYFSVPIAGWSSTVEMSNDTDTRVVGARYSSSAGNAISGTTRVDFATKNYDTHNAVTVGANWRFTCFVPGIYDVNVQVAPNTATSKALRLYKNGSQYSFNQNDGDSVDAYVNLNDSVQMVAGDYLEIYHDNGANASLFSDAQRNFVNIIRRSGPSAIAASETIAANYNTAAGQSIPDVTVTILDFGTSEFDTHSAVTTGGSWKFTAPSSGIYNVSACVTMAGVASDDGTNYSLYVYKNGSLDKYLAQTPKETNTTVELSIVGSVLVKLNGGDYIDVRIRQNSSVTRSLTTDADQNTISIHRI